MIGFTLGIAASDRNVILIRKIKGEQKDKLNFVGGHIELGESPIECMIREFEEETGVKTTKDQWEPIGTLKRENDFIVYVYSIKSNEVDYCHTTTLEKVIAVNKDNFLTNLELREFYMPNLLILYYHSISADFLKYKAQINIEYPAKS